MKRSLDGFSGLDSSPPHRYVPMFPPSAFANPLLSNEAPHHPAWSTARIPATVVKARRLDQCSLFAMICWTFSPVVHSYLPFLSLSLHCAVTTEHSPCFFHSPLSLPWFIPLLHRFYQLSPLFSLHIPVTPASHFIVFLSLSLIFPLPLCLASSNLSGIE